MFSGIVEEIGIIQEIHRGKTSAQIRIGAKGVLESLKTGESVSVNGACLTVVFKQHDGFDVDISPETLRATNLGRLKKGQFVNLERAVRLGDRMNGHLVTGHVDGVGMIRERQTEGDGFSLFIETPPDILKYCVAKGSIALDGISLTVNGVRKEGFSVMIIPFTAEKTTLGQKTVGDTVNLEADLIGKYVERLLKPT